jgi:hypothetical protein
MNFDQVNVLGADFNAGIIVMLQGAEAGTVATFNDGGAAFGADVSTALADGLYFYTGDIGKLGVDNFGGKRTSINIAATYILDLGIEVRWTKELDIGGRLWNISGSAGIGGSPYLGSFNLNFGEMYNINRKAKFTFPQKKWNNLLNY